MADMLRGSAACGFLSPWGFLRCVTLREAAGAPHHHSRQCQGSESSCPHLQAPESSAWHCPSCQELGSWGTGTAPTLGTFLGKGWGKARMPGHTRSSARPSQEPQLGMFPWGQGLALPHRTWSLSPLHQLHSPGSGGQTIGTKELSDSSKSSLWGCIGGVEGSSPCREWLNQ